MTKRETGEAARQVPAVAAAIVDFLNSRPHATPTLPDTLASPGDSMLALRPFSTQSELAPSDDDLRRARELRSDLMAVVAPSGGAAEREAWGRLSQHAAAAPFRYTFPGGEVHVEPADGDTLTGRIIRFVAELISSGNWSRIKACDDPERRPVLIHCARGTCRTGAAVALYRFERDGWTIDDVSAEMKHQTYREGWLPGYVYGMVRTKPAQELFEPSIAIDHNLPPAHGPEVDASTEPTAEDSTHDR